MIAPASSVTRPSPRKASTWLAKLAATTVDLAGAALDNYDPFIEAFGALAEAHIGPPYAVIMHPRTDTSLSLVKEFTTSGSNVGLPRPANFPPTYVTSQIGLTTGASPTTSALVYAPRLIQVVRRLDTEIVVDRAAAFTSDSVLIRGRVRATIGTQYPRAIALIKNIAAAPIAGVTTQSLSAGQQAQDHTSGRDNLEDVMAARKSSSQSHRRAAGLGAAAAASRSSGSGSSSHHLAFHAATGGFLHHRGKARKRGPGLHLSRQERPGGLRPTQCPRERSATAERRRANPHGFLPASPRAGRASSRVRPSPIRPGAGAAFKSKQQWKRGFAIGDPAAHEKAHAAMARGGWRALPTRKGKR